MQDIVSNVLGESSISTFDPSHVDIASCQAFADPCQLWCDMKHFCDSAISATVVQASL